MFRLPQAKAGKLILIVSLITIILGAVFMAVMACLVRYTAYMILHPYLFAFEVLLVSLVTAIPIFWIAHTRHAYQRRTLYDAAFLGFKFAILWVLFELSGTNATIFTKD